MENNILGYALFNSSTSVGIVLIESFGGKKAYIGTVKGQNKEEDLEYLKNWGCKFSVEEAITLIKKCGTFLSC